MKSGKQSEINPNEHRLNTNSSETSYNSHSGNPSSSKSKPIDMNAMLRRLSRAEFIGEQIVNYLARSQRLIVSHANLLSILCGFEFLKLYLRYLKFTAADSNSHIYLSEDNLFVEYDAREQREAEEFQASFIGDTEESTLSTESSLTNSIIRQPSNHLTTSTSASIESLSAEELRNRIAASLERIRSQTSNAKGNCINSTFNANYEEILQRSHRRVALLSKLPVPAELMANKVDPAKQEDIVVRVGEYLFMVRPLVYSLGLRVFGTRSYVPYVLSLVIDVLRMILQREVKFHSLAQKEEFKQRNKELIISYLLRNPFYVRVFRRKILLPLLHALFGKRYKFAKEFIIGVIEMRCSVCLLL